VEGVIAKNKMTTNRTSVINEISCRAQAGGFEIKEGAA